MVIKKKGKICGCGDKKKNGCAKKFFSKFKNSNKLVIYGSNLRYLTHQRNTTKPNYCTK